MNIKGITANSKEVQEGYIFVAIKGTVYDGHDFVEEALQRGAIRVYVERDVKISDPRIVKVENTRKVLGELADKFYQSPSKRLKVIGITGTNGKTTTTHIIELILKAGNIKVGLMGTVYYRMGDKVYQREGRTTPDPIIWHRTLKTMLDDGASMVVSEISSHALDQMRVWPTRFFIVGFTNLTQDHLDYHKDMESYFQSKLRLFTDYDYEFGIVNADDPYGRRIIQACGKKIQSYGRNGDLEILSFETGFNGSQIRVNYKGRTYTFNSNLLGNFQAYNLSAGILAGFLLGLSPETIQKGLSDVYVPGRFEVYNGGDFLVIVDYAHTPDALEKVLLTAQGLKKGRLICVFGAGGNRDRTKRPIMGAIASKHSDIVVITSDNPRFEEPIDIIRDILEGVEEKNKVIVEPDRKKAIEVAVSMARSGDVVLIAGKGHEDYQEIKGVRYPFKDSDVVRELLHVRL